MITAVDTNVLLDILLPSPEWYERSLAALQEAEAVGGLVVCDIVHAELLVFFDSVPACREFLDDVGIRVERVRPEAALAAARAWKDYRRRGGRRERILPDFLIGAHAFVQAGRLLTRDRGRYKSAFRRLDVVRP